MKNFLKKHWPLAISTVLFVLVLLISLYYKNTNIQAIRDATIAFLITLLIQTIYRINSYHDLVESQETPVSNFISLLSKTPTIKEIVKIASEINEKKDRFHDFFINTVFEQYNNQLRIIQQGKYVCAADDELLVTKKVLECCTVSLKAISYEDEAWWCGNDGILYLKAHEENIDKNKEKATRIFLINSTHSDKFKDVFKKHVELGVETYVLYLDKDNIDKRYLIDFVLYDDYILRRAYEGVNSKGGKDALFTTDLTEIKKYSNYFDEILVIAQNISNTIPN